MGIPAELIQFLVITIIVCFIGLFTSGVFIAPLISFVLNHLVKDDDQLRSTYFNRVALSLGILGIAIFTIQLVVSEQLQAFCIVTGLLVASSGFCLRQIYSVFYA
jgi:hypothetical protein